MPLFVRRSTGLPLEAPSYWLTSERRPLGTQANTLEQNLRNVILLYLWGDARGINPVERIQSPAFLKLSELNDLDRFCRKRVEEAVSGVQGRAVKASNVVKLTRRRNAKGLPDNNRYNLRRRTGPSVTGLRVSIPFKRGSEKTAVLFIVFWFG